jgi:acyl-CoA reductase-like NAD-dependent aldehyde dehydrogenase
LSKKSEKPVDPAKSEAGRLGAENRWAKVSSKERSKLMRAAARARWGPPKKPKSKNPAAAKLAKLRWKQMTPEERKNAVKAMNDARRVRETTTPDDNV